MVDTARADTTASPRRDAILEAVAFAAERLLLSSDWRDAAGQVLARLGVAAHVSRAYVIESRLDATGRPCCAQVAEWCGTGVASQFDNLVLQGLPWADFGFDRWVDVLSGGSHVSGAVAGRHVSAMCSPRRTSSRSRRSRCSSATSGGG